MLSGTPPWSPKLHRTIKGAVTILMLEKNETEEGSKSQSHSLNSALLSLIQPDGNPGLDTCLLRLNSDFQSWEPEQYGGLTMF